MRILLIEDDDGLGSALGDHLAAGGHAADWFTTLAEASAAAATVAYDLILLDLMLPDGRGITFLRALRGSGAATPVIILTAQDHLSDRIEGLNAGADDYLVKPFDLAELDARIGSVTRRYRGNPNPGLSLAGLVIDLATRDIRDAAGQPIDLTAREWVVLEALAARPGQIVAKPVLEDRLYAFGAEVESNTVEVYVSRLRRKLGAAAIETRRGLGYRLAAP